MLKGLFKKKKKLSILTEEDHKTLIDVERAAYLKEAKMLVETRGTQKAQKQYPSLVKPIKPKKEVAW